MAKIKADNLKNIQDALGKEIQAYEQANKQLEIATKKSQDAVKARAAIAKEFQQLGNDMRGGAGGATFGDVLSLKAGAREAVQRGDSAEAIRQAREAAKVLRELQDSGANSYGFSGIAGELAQIADQAARLDELSADVERIDAQGRVDQIKSRMDDLLAQAEAFKRINIEFNGFEQSAAALEQQAIALAERLKKYMVIPVNYIGADADAAKTSGEASKQAGEFINGKPPLKRATGGWIDGPGSTVSDSILVAASRKEFMLNARSAERLGAANLDYMNRTGELPGRDPFVPDFPTLPNLERAGERQPLNLAMPWGGSYALEGAPAEVTRFQDDLHRAAMKFGRPF